MGFSGKKWELIGDRGIYRNYERYTLSWGLCMEAQNNASILLRDLGVISSISQFYSENSTPCSIIRQ